MVHKQLNVYIHVKTYISFFRIKLSSVALLFLLFQYFQMQLQVRLREESRSHIEALLLQGDLIEVSLEETKWLWQLLQMSQPRAQPSISMEDPEEEVAVEEEEVEAAAEEEVEAAAEEVKVDVETVEEPPAKAARLES